MQDNQMTEGMQNFAAFITMAEGNEELAAKIEEISKGDELEIAPRLIRLGADCGFHFTESDIGHFADQTYELSQEQMEMVSGGCNSTASGLGKIVGQWAKTKCFTADCTVAAPGGAKSVRDIRVGDEVLSLDAEGNQRTGKVTDVMAPREMPILRVSFENGKQWLTTDTQWFYCGNDDYACVKEDGGKKAVTEDGGLAGVIKVEETGRIETVYDFAVDGLNVFFINGIAAEGFSLS